MGNYNGNARGGQYSSRGAKTKKHTAAWKQILVSLFLLLDLFLLYTIIMQLTHQQKAFEASKTVNLALLGLFAFGALVLSWLVVRTRAWKRSLCITLICAIVYLIVAFSNLPLVKKYREIWISTAMTTMRHQGLATYYFPADAVEAITKREEAARDNQVGINTIDNFTQNADDHNTWTNLDEQSILTTQDKLFASLNPEQQEFYALFYELDIASAEAWFKAHPGDLEDGYQHVLIDESSLDSDGTTIRTKLGEKVLAIDVENQILILEVDCDGSRGVMAIGKHPSSLGLYPSTNLPSWGETVGGIAEHNGGVLAMTGSGFIDDEGAGNGSEIAGWAMCSNGKTYGDHYGYGYKRLELHENGWFYINDAFASVGNGTVAAMEFTPGLLINGIKLDPGIWTSQNPRACIGKSEQVQHVFRGGKGRRAKILSEH